MTQPHKTIIDQSQVENGRLAQLTAALRQQMLKKIRENKKQKSMNCRSSSGSPGVTVPKLQFIPELFCLDCRSLGFEPRTSGDAFRNFHFFSL